MSDEKNYWRADEKNYWREEKSRAPILENFSNICEMHVFIYWKGNWDMARTIDEQNSFNMH